VKKQIWIIDDELSNYEIEEKIFESELYDYEVFYSKLEKLKEDLSKFGKNADAIITQISVNISKEIINELNNCRIISNYGTGYNNIDIDAARERNIQVGYVPGYCAEDIADYVMSAILHLSKPIVGFNSKINNGEWSSQAISVPINRISSKTLFIVGMGLIGGATAKKAAALGLNVLAYSPTLTDEKASKYSAKCVALEEGLHTADFVSVHLKYTKETANFLNKSHFALMKKDAYLINTSRGGVLDQSDLVDVIRNKKIAGAILDVLACEPPAKDDMVLSTPGIIVTPHVSYYSVEALCELQRRAAENVVKVLNNQPGADVVPM
jgi:D-3-phosphoglycerate dehydrogenase / 2-oxoglutarate reductase